MHLLATAGTRAEITQSTRKLQSPRKTVATSRTMRGQVLLPTGGDS